jgi:TonB family protein
MDRHASLRHPLLPVRRGGVDADSSFATASRHSSRARSDGYAPAQREYSPEARAAGLQGTVLVSLEVTPEGTVREVQVRRGLGLGLDEKAVAAAKQLQYLPFSSNGRSIMQVTEVPFRFLPRGSGRVVGSKFSFPCTGRRL